MWEHTHQESILSLGIQLNEISICAEKSRCSHKLQAQQVTTLSWEQTSEILCLSGTTGSTCAEASSKGITFKTYHHLLLEKTAHGHHVHQMVQTTPAETFAREILWN